MDERLTYRLVFSSGRYTINVKYGDKHVPNSPFRVRAGPPFDANKVKVSGPGVDESPVTDVPVQFVADCTEAGTAPLTGLYTPKKRMKATCSQCLWEEKTPWKRGCHESYSFPGFLTLRPGPPNW